MIPSKNRKIRKVKPTGNVRSH